jgi:predicted small metal-binding protein
MPSYKCRDTGMKCDFEVTADTEAELERIIAEHAHTAHNIDPIQDDLWRKIKNVIR